MTCGLEGCGVIFTPWRDKEYCSNAHAKLASQRRVRGNEPRHSIAGWNGPAIRMIWIRPCGSCPQYTVSIAPNRKWCDHCVEEKRRIRNRINAQAWSPRTDERYRAMHRDKEACSQCGAEYDISHQLDHIKPIAIHRLANTMEDAHDWENLQVLCVICHKSKTAIDKSDIAAEKKVVMSYAG